MQWYEGGFYPAGAGGLSILNSTSRRNLWVTSAPAQRSTSPESRGSPPPRRGRSWTGTPERGFPCSTSTPRMKTLLRPEREIFFINEDNQVYQKFSRDLSRPRSPVKRSPIKALPRSHLTRRRGNRRLADLCLTFLRLSLPQLRNSRGTRAMEGAGGDHGPRQYHARLG